MGSLSRYGGRLDATRHEGHGGTSVGGAHVTFSALPFMQWVRYDATIYARALGARSPGTHNLAYVEEADHNFTGVRKPSHA